MAVIARDTRQHIVTLAAELFRKQGYAATTMQQVSEQAGISKGNLTYHFPSKQVLFEEVHAQVDAYVRERILRRSFAEAPDTLAGMEDFTRRLRRWMLDSDGHFIGCIFTNIAIETQHSEAVIQQLNRGTLTAMKAMLAEQLAVGQARGEVRSDMPADKLARAFFWMYEGAIALSRAMDDPAEYDAFRTHLHLWLLPGAP